MLLVRVKFSAIQETYLARYPRNARANQYAVDAHMGIPRLSGRGSPASRLLPT